MISNTLQRQSQLTTDRYLPVKDSILEFFNVKEREEMKNFLFACLVFSTGIVNAAMMNPNLTTIDFNSVSLDNVGTYTDQGVTFSAPGGKFSSKTMTPNGTVGLLTERFTGSIQRPAFRADIAGGTDFVSVDLGDFGMDLDTIFLKVFDASDNLLSSTSLICCSSMSEMFTLSLTAKNISYALFGSTGIFANSVFADNFTFNNNVSAVPIPAAVWLFGSGLVGLIGIRRKSKLAVQSS